MYFHFNPEMKGVEFRAVGDGLYEQFFLHHPSTDAYHATFYTFPEQSEYSMKDLFSKHPTKPNLWFYEGRSDDVIVFSNGEKFNPSAMEATLRTHPDVIRVIVVGQARFEPAALIELKGSPSEEGKKDLLDSFTPYLIKVNEIAPAYAKLQRDHIAFTKPDKPMSMADKGTVKRAATTKAYEKEIDQLYADADDASLPTIKLNAHDQDALTKGLQHLLVGTIGLEAIAPEQDIFAIGADSLQVMNLVRQLRSSFTAQQGEGSIPPHLITPKIIYSNPTAAKLANALHQLTGHSAEAFEKLEEERIEKMEEMLTKYSKNLPKAFTDAIDVREGDDKFTVVLTGSTGSLGSYLLDALLVSDRVSKVICLNRGAHSEDKQKSSNASRGLITEWEKDKVQFLTTNLGKPRLGLDIHDYDLLVKEASFIIRKSTIVCSFAETVANPSITQITNGKWISTSASSHSRPTSPASVISSPSQANLPKSPPSYSPPVSLRSETGTSNIQARKFQKRHFTTSRFPWRWVTRSQNTLRSCCSKRARISVGFPPSSAEWASLQDRWRRKGECGTSRNGFRA